MRQQAKRSGWGRQPGDNGGWQQQPERNRRKRLQRWLAPELKEVTLPNQRDLDPTIDLYSRISPEDLAILSGWAQKNKGLVSRKLRDKKPRELIYIPRVQKTSSAPLSHSMLAYKNEKEEVCWIVQIKHKTNGKHEVGKKIISAKENLREEQLKKMLRLGGGGMSKIYWGVDLHTQEVYAISQPKQQLVQFKSRGGAESEESSEAKLLAKISSSYIIHPICYGQYERIVLKEVTSQRSETSFIAGLTQNNKAPKKTQTTLVTPYVKHGDLHNANELVVSKNIMRIVASLLIGVKVLHDRDICHNDIKPLNALLTNDLIGRLIDMGGATLEGQNITEYTPRYASPEMMGRGGSISNKANDIWALGVSISELNHGDHSSVKELVRGMSQRNRSRRFNIDQSIIYFFKELAIEALNKSKRLIPEENSLSKVVPMLFADDNISDLFWDLTPAIQAKIFNHIAAEKLGSSVTRVKSRGKKKLEHAKLEEHEKLLEHAKFFNHLSQIENTLKETKQAQKPRESRNRNRNRGRGHLFQVGTRIEEIRQDQKLKLEETVQKLGQTKELLKSKDPVIFKYALKQNLIKNPISVVVNEDNYRSLSKRVRAFKAFLKETSNTGPIQGRVLLKEILEQNLTGRGGHDFDKVCLLLDLYYSHPKLFTDEEKDINDLIIQHREKFSSAERLGALINTVSVLRFFTIIGDVARSSNSDSQRFLNAEQLLQTVLREKQLVLQFDARNINIILDSLLNVYRKTGNKETYIDLFLNTDEDNTLISQCGGPSGFYARCLKVRNDDFHVEVASELGKGLIRNGKVTVPENGMHRSRNENQYQFQLNIKGTRRTCVHTLKGTPKQIEKQKGIIAFIENYGDEQNIEFFDSLFERIGKDKDSYTRQHPFYDILAGFASLSLYRKKYTSTQKEHLKLLREKAKTVLIKQLEGMSEKDSRDDYCKDMLKKDVFSKHLERTFLGIHFRATEVKRAIREEEKEIERSFSPRSRA